MASFSPRKGLPVADNPWGVSVRFEMDVENIKRIVKFMESTVIKYAGFEDRQEDLLGDMQVSLDKFYDAMLDVEDTIARIRSRER